MRIDKKLRINYIELYYTKKDNTRICVKDELIRLKHAIHNPDVFGKLIVMFPTK